MKYLHSMYVSRTSQTMAAAAALLVCIPPALDAQPAPPTKTTIRDSRPLAKAAELLELEYGLQINYEDPAYAYQADVRDITDPQYKAAHPNARVLIPAGGSVDVDLPPTASAPLALVRSVLQTHNSKGNPGVFTVIQNGQALNIIPSAIRNQAGILVPHNSPLDALITFPQQERSGLDALKLICELVTNASGRKVVIGTVPSNLLSQKTISIKADNEPAREILTRCLSELQWKNSQVTLPSRQLAYQLFYGPDVQTYAVNVHMMMQEVHAPNGGRVKIYVEH